MDRISQLLDDQTVSLDEVLAFIDSSDFDLAAKDGQGEQVADSAFSDPLDIAEALMQTSAIPEEIACSTVSSQQPCQAFVVSAPQTQASGCSVSHSRELASSASSRWLKVSVEPYKEHGRVRERVIRLRGMVAQLERHLGELNALKYHNEARGENSDENEASAVNAEPAATQDSEDVVTWHQLAVRQYAARRAAEKENLSLKEHLEEQIRLAKRLERLIQGQL